MSFQLAYCTNVHAGSDLAKMTASLREHALGVKRRFSPHQPMGIGLWLAASAARELRVADKLASFSTWLADCGLIPFTLNGFPHGDFHDSVVKHQVYRPTWFETARLDYTLDLVTILDAILPPEMEGSISTLPVAWGDPPLGEPELNQAAANLLQVARRLAEWESETGRLIYLCLEPEPGCVLQRGSDVVRFFDERLLRGGNGEQVLRYLRVCHDVCHAAVMFEDQRDVLARHAAAGIKVGKLQVSSAIRIDLDALDPAERTAALSELALFAEDRYLHQTMIRSTARAPQFFEDLTEPLRNALGGVRRNHGQWRSAFPCPDPLGTIRPLGHHT